MSLEHVLAMDTIIFKRGTYHDGHPRIAQQIIYEARQRELDILTKITGEILVNEYLPGQPWSVE